MNNDQKPLNPKIVLGVAAHPDDLDFSASGTMAAFAAQGAAVHYLILTNGGNGTEDRTLSPAELTTRRHQEQQAALKAIGGVSVSFLDNQDGFLVNDKPLKRDIVSHIRRLKPDLVITMDPSVLYSAERGFINHPDHRAAGQATLDSVFPLARDHLSFPDLLEEGLEPHKVATILLTNMERQNFYVDISQTIDQKWQALKAHQSQMKDFELIKQRFTGFAENLGQASGYKLAEGFIRIDIN